MMFFYDKISGKTGIEQYNDYLDNLIYLNQLRKSTGDITNYQLLEIRRGIYETSSTTRSSLDSLAKCVCGTLQNGFNSLIYGLNNIEWQLNELNNNFSELYSLLDYKLDLVIEEQKITNFYLGNIERLMHKPESLKESCRYLERGMAWLLNAFQEEPSSPFYGDALEDFQEAYKFDKKDFLCMQKLGMVHYFYKRECDPEKALNYFISSSIYAIALSKTVSSNFNNTYLSSFTKEKLLDEAATSLEFASRCCYILNRPLDCIKYIEQAIQLQPQKQEYKFYLVKFLASSNQADKAALLLKELILSETQYAVKMLGDQDLNSNPIIINMIEDLRNELEEKINKIFGELSLLKTDINNNTKVELEQLEKRFLDKSYINLRDINRILSVGV